jgi:NDP-sugar pyrophosphorylase family protein
LSNGAQRPRYARGFAVFGYHRSVLPALVLTAGLGSRLDPITRLLAKPAVPLGGQTLIERVLRGLRAQGVTDTVLNLHHLPATVTAIAGDGAHLDMRVRYSWEQPILGSAGGPRHALPLLDAETFLIVNGDTLCDVDLAAMIAAHQAAGALVTMAVAPNAAPDRYNGLSIKQDRIAGVVPRGSGVPSWHFVGVQVVSASVFEALPDGVPAESVHGLYQPLMSASAAGGIHAHRVTAPFHDVGTAANYLAAATALSGGATIEPGATLEPGARAIGCVVWSGASIGEDALLEECIVTDVEIPPGFRTKRAVIVPAVVHRATDAAQVVGNLSVFSIDR